MAHKISSGKLLILAARLCAAINAEVLAFPFSAGAIKPRVVARCGAIGRLRLRSRILAAVGAGISLIGSDRVAHGWRRTVVFAAAHRFSLETSVQPRQRDGMQSAQPPTAHSGITVQLHAVHQ